jgi:7,8-dihydro-6-hydroxymethylpterin dimethyltransferase
MQKSCPDHGELRDIVFRDPELQGLTDKKLGRDGMDGTFTYRTLLVANMHFQDAYNYDIEHVKRCVIHYATPDGKLCPLCTYNSGPYYREKIERQLSIPWDPKALQPMTIEA